MSTRTLALVLFIVVWIAFLLAVPAVLGLQAQYDVEHGTPIGNVFPYGILLLVASLAIFGLATPALFFRALGWNFAKIQEKVWDPMGVAVCCTVQTCTLILILWIAH